MALTYVNNDFHRCINNLGFHTLGFHLLQLGTTRPHHILLQIFLRMKSSSEDLAFFFYLYTISYKYIFIHIHITECWLTGFYVILIHVGYLMPNLAHIYII